MKRQFSMREKGLLLVLALMLLFCLYYLFVDKPVRDTMLEAAERQSAAESELVVANAKLERMHAMQEALAGLEQGAVADVPNYDNSQEVVRLLNTAMALSNEYNLSFREVTRDGAIAVRPIDMEFLCDNYETAKRILQTLLDSPYRCRITSMDVSCGDSGDIRAETVTVKAGVAFYEYLSPEQRATQ